jgi:geranylgeranyl diphosphate synthase type II
MAQGSCFSLREYATEVRTRIDDALRGHTELEEGCPEVLQAAMRYALLAPGKRLRPMLVLLAAAACGGSETQAMPGACAVEMVHAYSLVHDDLPAMDDDDLRRGRPTCHKVYGEAVAILAGDALLALAFEVLARHIQPPATAVACVRVLAGAAGACNLVGGQTDDLRASGPAGRPDTPCLANRPIPAKQASGTECLTCACAAAAEDAAAAGAKGDLAGLESIHRRKTAAMILASLQLGGLLADAEGDRPARLEQYGRRVGLAFQIADDLLDVRGDEATAGKRLGKDHRRGKLTFPGVLGVSESLRRAEQLVAGACEAIRPLGAAAEGLVALARYVVERNR